MKSINQSILKHIINTSATVLIGSVAFVFAILALSYKSTDFLSANHAIIGSIFYGIIFTLVIVYFIFYLYENKTACRLITFLLVCILIFSLLFYIVCASGLITKITSIQSLREYILNAGNMAVVLYVLFQFLQVVVLPVPGSVSVAAGVALFGPLKCAILSFIGITLGSFVAFAVGRLVGYRAVSWVIGKESLQKWMQKVKGKDYLILSLMFLLPLFPDDVLCFVAGLSSMSWQYFIIMITITRALSIFSTAFSFGFIPINTWWGCFVWGILIALVVISFWFVFKFSNEIDKFIKNKFKYASKVNKEKFTK